jgi:hypothetical protein
MVRRAVVCAMVAGVLVIAGAADPDAGQPAAPSGGMTVQTDLPRGEFCVSPNGSDQAKGSETEPWRTIQYAVDHAAPGSVVQVRAGVYHESVGIANRGTRKAALTLRGYPGERPVLDGEFSLADGIVLSGDNVRVSGLEIRDYLSSGIQIRAGTDRATIDHNVIHHISSNIDGTKATAESSWGIRAVAANNCLIENNTIYLIVGRTESMGILFDVRSEFRPWIRGARIRNNLIYLCDKSGIRFANYSDTGPGGTDSDSVIERNICVHNAYVGIETNGIVCDHAIRIRNNFAGWNTAYGMNPKQSHHAEFTHNTIYKSGAQGFLYSGEPYLSHCRCQGNLMVDNVVGSWVQTVGTDNTLEGNCYVQHAPWLDVFADRTRGWGTLWKSIDEVKRGTTNGYERNGRQGDGDPFVNADNGDFRVKDGSGALASASDGRDFGALADVLQKVGAGEEYGLSHIPILNELPLRLTAFSGEIAADCTVDHYPAHSPTGSGADAAQGLVTHLTDGAIVTCWGVDPKTGGWAEFELPGDQSVPLSCVMVCSNHTQGYRPEVTVRDFAIYVRKSKGAPWEHVRDFVKQRREEGQIFLLPEGTTAKMVKLEVKTNYGDPERIEVAEFKVFGDPLILPRQ